MISYVPYADDFEVEQPDEPSKIADIGCDLGVIHERVIEARRHAPRETHPKIHGFLQETFTIESGLPEELAQAVFAMPGAYPAVLRFATESGALGDDRRTAAPDWR